MGWFSVVGVCLIVTFPVSHQLKDVRIKVPPAVQRGHDATLQCFFDLEGDKLYSVKWYRGQYEFYRYNLNEQPPIKQFKIKGMHVREEDSKDTQVVLEGVSKDISGLFSCEVTTDQPSFFTDMQTAFLEVVDLPQEDPYITGLKPRYRLEETLKANCTSENANPPANLTWRVNGLAVNEQHVRKHKAKMTGEDRLYTAISTLRFRVTKKLFENGRMKIRCSASVHDLYHRSSEKSVELEKRKPRPRYEENHAPPRSFEGEVPGGVSREQEEHVETETRLTFTSLINSLSSTGRLTLNKSCMVIFGFFLVFFLR